MDRRKTESLYLTRRVSDSLAMAAAASGPCAHLAHMTLAKLYGEALDALDAQAKRPTLQALFSKAGAGRASGDRAGSPQATLSIDVLAQG